MAQADWERLTLNTIDESDISQGISTDASFSPPHGSTCFGFHVLSPVTGVAGYVTSLADYGPITNSKGGTVIACMRKYVKNRGYAPVIFFVNGKDVSSAKGYILGLSEGYPYKIVLRKGLLIGGLDETSDGLLGASEASYDDNDWHNLLLVVTVNLHGDVVVRVRKDADPPTPTGPSWSAVNGIDDVIDDVLGAVTGDLPITGDFYAGFGHYNSGESGRLSLFDYFRVSRQTSP